ncbi:hypothetical protein [Roseibium aggregatum]|uniref:hypothetical protein n=1 Tax=Roseibium aggregatum TaxID=187304 RepID=UPI001E324B45|nr:hypothetical protein [Roseibium aggregatum]UES52662.1 hypothetical protein GFK88_25355 [Roseibium aggregatum]
MPAHRARKLPEAFRRDGCLQDGKIGKVVLRRSMGNAGTGGARPQRKGFKSIFAQNVQPCLDQGLFQIAVVIFQVAQACFLRK